MLKKWWHNKIVYQIYPKSFNDHNNDGIGDILGIVDKLDYLKELGVDIIWLTPHYKSPMEDNGYDVADYYHVNDIFGTDEDMDLLLEECKKRNMYIMMDIVANHTSSQHEWFKQSLKGKDNPYRDYYVWRDEPLFNYHSVFGGSAWKYDENSKQYYLHQFAEGQPDLNWENPKVLDEMAACINYWLKKGVKGIRFDVIHLIGKAVDQNILGYGPTLHQKVHELYEKSYGKYDVVTVGEAWGDLDKAIEFTNPKHEELDMVSQFECTSSNWSSDRLGKYNPHEMDMEHVKNTLIKYQNGLNELSWNALFVENHDLARSVNKFGSLKYHKESAKAIATMNFLLKGTPYIYQGQEIGMCNIKMEDIAEYDDVEVHNSYKDFVINNKLMSHDQFLEGCNKESRDNARTPMQWDDSVNAGFNKSHKTWLKVNPNYKQINVKEQLSDEDSILNYYKKLLKVRKDEKYSDIFVYGDFKAINSDIKNVFIYTRNYNDESIAVVVNMKDNVENITLPFNVNEVLLSNYNKKYDNTNVLSLQPYESLVFKI